MHPPPLTPTTFHFLIITRLTRHHDNLMLTCGGWRMLAVFLVVVGKFTLLLQYNCNYRNNCVFELQQTLEKSKDSGWWTTASKTETKLWWFWKSERRQGELITTSNLLSSYRSRDLTNEFCGELFGRRSIWPRGFPWNWTIQRLKITRLSVLTSPPFPTQHPPMTPPRFGTFDDFALLHRKYSVLIH